MNPRQWLSLKVKGDDIEERLAFIPSDFIDGITLDTHHAEIFLKPENLSVISEWISSQGITILSENNVKIENWTAKCENLLEPLSIGKLLILPFAEPKEVDLKNNEIGVIAGLGFGTGHHESTKIALELLQKPEVLESKPKKIIDIGTGSGILAIASKKLFETSVLAIDNDPLALINTKDNVKLNHTEQIDIVASTADAIRGEFDLITANIYAEVLIELAEVFNSLLSKTQSSFLILSGIEKSKRDMVDNSLEKSTWRHIASMTEGNWCGILYGRNLNR